MNSLKRMFDISVALIIFIPLLPLMILVGVLVLITDGRPVFYLSERMKSVDQAFTLFKFRSMKITHSNDGVTGGDKSDRIITIGRFLRRTRLDELPQLFNVLKGDLSFVGPRPPLRQYVNVAPELYEQVLKSRPGITGLASVYFSKREERILSRCKTFEETDRVYRENCIPRKATLDLIYQKNRSICFDIYLMIKTVVN